MNLYVCRSNCGAVKALPRGCYCGRQADIFMEMKSLLSHKKNASAKISVPINKCRVCGHDFFEEPLLRYENMPRAAQFLPDAESLESDKGVALEVCQCSGCGLVQISNDPVPYYKEVIRAAAFSDEMKGFEESNSVASFKNIPLKERKSLRSAAAVESTCPLCSNLE